METHITNKRYGVEDSPGEAAGIPYLQKRDGEGRKQKDVSEPSYSQGVIIQIPSPKSHKMSHKANNLKHFVNKSLSVKVSGEGTRQVQKVWHFQVQLSPGNARPSTS